MTLRGPLLTAALLAAVGALPGPSLAQAPVEDIGREPVADASSEPDQLMNMVLQLQQLQDELRELRGLIEEQGFDLDRLEQRQRDQYLDLDQRLSELRSGLPAVSGGAPGGTSATGGPAVVVSSSNASPGPNVGPTAPTVSRGAAGQDVPEVREAVDRPSTVTGIAAPRVESRTAAATPEAEQEAYDKAFKALKELRYADAAEEFRSFLGTYPDSDLADNAQYWLGESYYVTRNYEIALEAFEELVDRFPDSAKAGDGLLKIGFTHYELEHYDQARAALEEVQERYPDTTLARLADSRLRSMRLAGQF